MSHATKSPVPLFDTLQAMRHGQTANDVVYPADYRHASEFLLSYRGSEATFNSYRRELERLLHWSWHIEKKSICELRRQDIERFVEFCQKPPKNWIGIKNVARFKTKEGQRIANDEWRPFVVNISKTANKQGNTPSSNDYTLSQKALQALFAVLGSFYNYLIQEDYIELNPVSQIRQKSKFIRKQQDKLIIRRLSELQWGYVIDTALSLAQQNPEKHERTLFIMQALYGMYLRISELSASARWEPQMGDFQKDMDGNWWFTTVGKGNKSRNISVSDDVLNALKRYRQSLGLTPLPSLGEQTPLILKSHGKGPISSTRQIRAIVQFCFDEAIGNMRQDGFSEEADQMQAATVHWLRHTGISDDVKTRPREHVRDDAGHGSSAITDRYIDVELRARHASKKKQKIKPDA